MFLLTDTEQSTLDNNTQVTIEDLGDVTWTTQHVDDPWLIRDAWRGSATGSGGGGWKHETASNGTQTYDNIDSRWRRPRPAGA